MLKIALLVLFIVTVAGLGVFLAGLSLPVKHQASRSIVLDRRPEDVWRVITEFADYGAWRDDLRQVEPVTLDGAATAWQETTANGDSITYRTLSIEPPHRLVREIADRNLPFGGRWEFMLQAQEAGTRLTITENGEVYNPVFRFFSRFVFGHYASIDKYLGQLQKHFGSDHRKSLKK